MREKGTQYLKEQDQPSPGDSKEVTTDRYTTCWEKISDIEPASIRPCPIIPDYTKPTKSRFPIIVRTPTADFCIDGWNYIEQAKAVGRATIRCHVSQIENHSDAELAIRKVAIRVIPRGGKCSYAELVRNTYRLYHALKKTSDNLVLFSHGGDRRGVDFTSCRENNIKAILATRLDKSPTTIAKYLQHGECLNDTAMNLLIDAGVPKLFFEAFQVKKQVEIAELRARQKDEEKIVADISNQVPTWLKEFQQHSASANPPSVNHRMPNAISSPGASQITPSEGRCHGERQKPSQVTEGATDSPAADPAPVNAESVETELRRIGKALIEIADSNPPNVDQSAQTVKDLITCLSLLLPHILHAEKRADGGKEGQV